MIGFFYFALGLLLGGDPIVATDDGCADYVARGEGSEINSLCLLKDGTFNCWAPNLSVISFLESRAHEGKPPLELCGLAFENQYSGKWRKRDSIVTLDFEFDRNKESHPPIPSRWMAVQWDHRRYLVPEGRIIDFCNEVNFGFEPRTLMEGRFALLADDHKKPAQGWPTLPEEWRSFLLLEPIQGKLLRIDEDGFGYLDIGEANCLRAGMVLLAYHEGQMRSHRLKVLCPCGPSARVEIIEVQRLEVPNPRAVMPGDIVTTKAL